VSPQLAECLYEEDATPAEEPGCPPALTSVLVSIRPRPLPDAFASILPEVGIFAGLFTYPLLLFQPEPAQIMLRLDPSSIPTPEYFTPHRYPHKVNLLP